MRLTWKPKVGPADSGEAAQPLTRLLRPVCRAQTQSPVCRVPGYGRHTEPKMSAAAAATGFSDLRFPPCLQISSQALAYNTSAGLLVKSLCDAPSVSR